MSRGTESVLVPLPPDVLLNISHLSVRFKWLVWFLTLSIFAPQKHPSLPCEAYAKQLRMCQFLLGSGTGLRLEDFQIVDIEWLGDSSLEPKAQVGRSLGSYLPSHTHASKGLGSTATGHLLGSIKSARLWDICGHGLCFNPPVLDH